MDGTSTVTEAVSSSTPAPPVTVSDSTPSSSTSKLIVVGVGKWGTNIAREAHALKFLVAIADTNSENIKTAYEKLGSPDDVTVHETLESALEAYPGVPVAVCTPVSMHFDCAKLALEAGRDVWVEKPLCSKLEDAITLVKNGRVSNRLVFVDHLLHYYATHRQLLMLVKSGFVGEVTRVRAIRLNFGTIRTSENALWSLAPHDLSLILAVCGNELPEIVKAEGQRVVSSDIEDYVDVHLSFATGVRAHLTSSWLHYEKERRLVVYGRDGCLVVNESHVPGKPKLQGFKWSAKRHADGSCVAIEKTEEDMVGALSKMEEGEVPETESPVCAALKQFIKCCSSRNPPITDGEEGVRVLRVLSAASESLKTGGAVRVLNGEEEKDGAKVKAFNDENLEDGNEVVAFNGKEEKGAEVVALNDHENEKGRAEDEPCNGENEKDGTEMEVCKDESGKDGTKVQVSAKGESSKREVNHRSVEMKLRLKEESSKYFVHPTAVVDKGANIGEGSKIWHFSHIMSGAVLGLKCNIGQNVYVGGKVVIGVGVKVQNNVSIYDGVTIEDEVFLGPHCVFTNVKTPRSAINRRGEYAETIVRKGATIGANSTIVCGITLGTHCFIGAGAVVTRNVPPHALVYGNPARVHGWVSHNGTRLVVVAKLGDGKMMMQCTETHRMYNFDGVETIAEIETEIGNGDERK